MPETITRSSWSRKKKIVGVVASLSAGVIALGGSFSAGYALPGMGPLAEQSEIAADALGYVLPEGRAQPVTPSGPERIRTCSVSSLFEAPALGTFAGLVTDPRTGEVLFSRNDDVEVTPASVAKLVTGAAALITLGPDTRFETTVVESGEPSRVVLVGGGDATLSSLRNGVESVYLGAPKISTLAEQTIATLGASLPEGEAVAISEVVLDLTLWDTEEIWDSSWLPDARANGFISQVTPLQVDGDRQDPSSAVSRRSDDAADRAARAFIDALRAAGNTVRNVTVTRGQAEPGARVLATVHSQPVMDLVTYMLKESDNTLAEMLGRHVSLAVGLGGGQETLNQALAGSLATRGMPVDEISLQDGSGLSNLNRVKPAYITALLGEIYRSETSLGKVRAGLPVAGGDGSLKDRFTGENSLAAGRVFAKTGSITGVRSLAGFVTAQDGSELGFAFFAMGDVGDDTKIALDDVVTGVYICGENLANF